MRHLPIAVAALFVVACAHSGTAPWTVPTGSTVVINQEIQIPAESASVKIQNGKTEKFLTINIYAPHCVLEVRKRLDTPQIVKPGRFTVTKNVQQEYLTLLRPGIRLAGLFASGVDSLVNYANEMYVTGPEQPNVFRLTCQQYSYPSQTMLNERWATVAQMQSALGSLISLNVTSPSVAGQP